MTRHTDYHAPAGLRTRGTVVLVTGRGETRAAYARLGSRLAYDAYRVRVVDPPSADAAGVATFLCDLAHQLGEAVAAIADQGPHGLVRPLVLAGADLGAAAIAALLSRGDRSASWWPEAVVLAGLPGHDARISDDGWDSELGTRTHCPVHRELLTRDASLKRGQLTEAVPSDLLEAAYGSTVDLPQLLLVGDADPLADRVALAAAVKALPKVRLAIVRGGHHDVLNDLQHRSVAAEVVTFLETVRNALTPVIDVDTSGW